ncbi:polysaccharide deacetylase [Sphingomonas flavalba]|uniref:polysaccharide deacetylase n=1 Tax=Sphingomonas flavalba TaxID=2559804 RepID=UPI00109E23C1|nr:polysaccharide deacetylase [Sphingomonas flavalba]
MTTRVLLTIDTELVWRHYAAGLDVADVIRRSIDPAGVGLRYQLALLGRHGLKACFFVDPMPALVLGREAIRAIVAPILAAGQEVQLHLHPNWAGATLDDRRAGGSFELNAYPPERQRALIAEARALLVEAGAPPPIAFRVGSFAADDATLAALAALGLRYDSSHNGSHAPWPSAIGLPAEQSFPLGYQGIIEVPVTQFSEGPGRLRPCQLTAASAGELVAAVDHAVGNGHPLVTLVSHSFELACRDGRRPNPVLVRRFSTLCRRLAERAERAPTAFFSELEAVPLGVVATPMPYSLRRTAGRMAAQAMANLLYEGRL